MQNSLTKAKKSAIFSELGSARWLLDLVKDREESPNTYPDANRDIVRAVNDGRDIAR